MALWLLFVVTVASPLLFLPQFVVIVAAGDLWLLLLWRSCGFCYCREVVVFVAAGKLWFLCGCYCHGFDMLLHCFHCCHGVLVTVAMASLLKVAVALPLLVLPWCCFHCCYSFMALVAAALSLLFVVTAASMLFVVTVASLLLFLLHADAAGEVVAVVAAGKLWLL